jgi:hypothetical protein
MQPLISNSKKKILLYSGKEGKDKEKDKDKDRKDKKKKKKDRKEKKKSNVKLHFVHNVSHVVIDIDVDCREGQQTR